jgi:hypothetical protein
MKITHDGGAKMLEVDYEIETDGSRSHARLAELACKF